MKYLIPALFMLCMFDATAAVDTSAIKNATTIDEATTAYRTAVEKLISDNKGKIDETEFTRAKETMEKNIANVDTAVADGTIANIPDTDPQVGTETATPQTPTEQKLLSEEDKKEQIKALEKNAEDMKKKEQSTANKLIGAAGIGLTGAGLRNTMEGMAEMQLDENATQSMKAYLQTFRCNWNGGGSYKGGEENIELPGAGVLMPLVTEYKTLASELKETKLALDMKPGIESEEILDSATMGLHDDERHGIESGAFTSVSRALLNEDGEDAAAWAKQGTDAKHKRNQGLALAAAGAVGSAVASGLVNKNAPKEHSEEINKEFEDKRQTVTTNPQSPTNPNPVIPTPDNNCPNGKITKIKCPANIANAGIGDADCAEITNCDGTSQTTMVINCATGYHGNAKNDGWSVMYQVDLYASCAPDVQSSSVTPVITVAADPAAAPTPKEGTLAAKLAAQTRPQWLPAEDNCRSDQPSPYAICLDSYPDEKFADLPRPVQDYITNCMAKTGNTFITAYWQAKNQKYDLIVHCFTDEIKSKANDETASMTYCENLIPSLENPTHERGANYAISGITYELSTNSTDSGPVACRLRAVGIK